ncbi:hypothetical protein QTO34_001024 [Cnephaeus nilssonii]|uniref:Uncharacterized protein n=1 Tax=Cnephaeus nilssonii TaxID=3371016 RepID=A0AA40LMX4_CNENI|nr:hypothetical protein QTO34_001024 [Eptesicus nilssonii]
MAWLVRSVGGKSDVTLSLFGGTEMETKKDSQLLMPLILLSVLFSQTWALPALEAEALRFHIQVKYKEDIAKKQYMA